MADTVFFAACAAVLTAAAVQDVRHRRISNLFPVALVVLYVALVIWRGGAVDLLSHLASFAFMFAMGAALFARGVLGGGDVKLLAATALWFEIPLLPAMVLAVVLCGGAIAALVIARQLFLPVGAGAGGKTPRRVKSVPYGVAIASGAIVFGWNTLPCC